MDPRSNPKPNPSSNPRPDSDADSSSSPRLRSRVRDSILQSLRAGVVPRTGQQHIQVGRADEVKAMLRDVQRVGEGGGAIRFVIGEYGSGKTFFLHLVRAIAMEKKLVCAHADLTPDRRLQASRGQAQNLYQELMRNLSTRPKPEGGALASVVERFVTSAMDEARKEESTPQDVIHARLEHLKEMVGGYDFAEVLTAYWKGHDEGNEGLKSDAIRWLRGEFATKTEARKALGVRSIVDDSSVYDHLKLFARFTRLAGYQGLLVCLDEMVNLYKIPHSRSRNSNYEQVLRIVNDGLQGISVGLGFVFCGTPEMLVDERRGLYSYAALRSRLTENSFAGDGLVDLSGPVLRLENLAPEDLFVLMQKIRHVFASGDPGAYLLPDDALHAFMRHCSKKIGEAYFRTPRNTITTFVNMLAVLEQNPETRWDQLVERVELPADGNPDLKPLDAAAIDGDEDDDELSTLRL